MQMHRTDGYRQIDTTSDDQPLLYSDFEPGSLAALDPSWINLSTLKLWLKTCDEEHGIECGHDVGVPSNGLSSLSPKAEHTHCNVSGPARPRRGLSSPSQLPVQKSRPEFALLNTLDVVGRCSKEDDARKLVQAKTDTESGADRLGLAHDEREEHWQSFYTPCPADKIALEEDEKYARQLQEEFDREVHLKRDLEHPQGDFKAQSAMTTLPVEVRMRQAHPQWLIDVQRGRLVAARPQDQYAALSYVWGQVPMLKAAQNNMWDLQRDRALFNYGDRVPRTIRDTISLVRLLEIPYLWVDCLCIIQDDEENLHRQLQDMASIYASAYVTIVAANGWDADHGLRGIRGITDPRQLSTNNPGDEYESLQPHSSIWYSRAWTFQEMCFSRRIIMFQYQVAIWGCNLSSWHEGSARLLKRQEDPISWRLQINPWGKGINFLPYPDPEQYMSILRDYNHRQLTHQTDAYRAIQGFISVWNQSYHGGFISGLPQMFFESALLWQPFHPMERRSLNNAAEVGDDHLPSWSWLGWAGEIDVLEWRTNWDFTNLLHPAVRVGSSFSPRTRPLHQWTFGNSRVHSSDVDVSSLRYVDGAYLPPGWRRDADQSSYSHERFRTQKFPYPIPLPNPCEQHDVPPLMKFLYFYTRRAIVKFALFREYYCGESSCLCMAIAGPRTLRNYGYLNLNSSILPDEFETPSGLGWRNLKLKSKGFDLIEMSVSLMLPSDPRIKRHSLCQDADNGTSSSLNKDGFVELVNVMWIERNDGVAYRKGLGQVLKHDWERFKPQQDFLTLG